MPSKDIPTPRITNGSITEVINASDVVRIGYGQIYEQIQRDAKSADLERYFRIYLWDGKADGKAGYFEEKKHRRVSKKKRNHLPHLGDLSTFLQELGMYLVHARLEIGGEQIQVYQSGVRAFFCDTADIYRNKERHNIDLFAGIEVPNILPHKL